MVNAACELAVADMDGIDDVELARLAVVLRAAAAKFLNAQASKRSRGFVTPAPATSPF
jgi:hypothetical protein